MRMLGLELVGAPVVVVVIHSVAGVALAVADAVVVAV